MLTAHNRPILSSNLSGRTNIESRKMAKSTKTKINEIVENETQYDPFEIVAEYKSDDKILKAVVRRNKMTSLYEIDFYNGKNFVVTESYAFHTRRYHEDAAENYVKGIKKI